MSHFWSVTFGSLSVFYFFLHDQLSSPLDKVPDVACVRKRDKRKHKDMRDDEKFCIKRENLNLITLNERKGDRVRHAKRKERND